MSDEPDDDARRALTVLHAEAMRLLPADERDELIAASPDVLDLRPALERNLEQRILASAYRGPGDVG